MNESDYNQLREESWRRKLTPAEEAELRAWLADHPESRMDWDMDSRLTHLLGRLDNAPVPSNFTARVLQAIEREAASEARQTAPKRNWFLHSFLPRTAAAMVVLAAGLLAYNEYPHAETGGIGAKRQDGFQRSVAAESGNIAEPRRHPANEPGTRPGNHRIDAMSSFRRKLFCITGALAFFSAAALAQPAMHVASPVAAKSPVTLFRELLAMSPEERQGAIAIRPPDIQKRILEKLQEYEVLPDELRELRLRETELRWYLRPLLDEPRTNRAARLALIPEDQRTIVEERLGLWDLLPPALQEEWKNDEMIANYFSQAQWMTDKERKELLDLIPPGRRAELQKGLDQWSRMSEVERQKTLTGFNRMFELTPEEKAKALDTVPDEERRQMEQTLASYANLTPEQRKRCINSFSEFASMSVAERQQFLKNADRWRQMTPEERQKWRNLVEVAPILPPSGGSGKLPVRWPRLGPPPVATN